MKFERGYVCEKGGGDAGGINHVLQISAGRKVGRG